VPLTPDRHPGPIDEDESILLEPQAVHPTANGQFAYVTGVGFRFFEEGQNIGLSGSGITSAQHNALKQLIHFIDDGPTDGWVSGTYKETTGTVFPTAEVWWTSSAKTHKIVSLNTTWVGTTPTQEVWKIYAADGSTVLVTLTDVITYTGVFEQTRTRTWT